MSSPEDSDSEDSSSSIFTFLSLQCIGQNEHFSSSSASKMVMGYYEELDF